jgi:hypothetical protein
MSSISCQWSASLFSCCFLPLQGGGTPEELEVAFGVAFVACSEGPVTRDLVRERGSLRERLIRSDMA